LPSVTDQFAKATPEEQKVIKDSYNKVMYNFLEDALEKVARDTRGAITYSDGVLSSNYTLDRDLIRDTNAILSEMKNVSWNAKGAVDSWKEVDNRIKLMVAEKSLGLENKSSVSSDLAAMMNPVAAGLGSVAGTEQGMAFGMTPREAARTSANMRRMGIGTEGFRKFVENTLSSAAAVSPTQYLSEIPQGIKNVSDRTREVGGQLFGVGVQKVEDELNKRSGNFLDFIKGFEGFRGETYDDVGQPAIGYGFRKSTLQNAPEETKKKLEQVVPGITSEGFNRITKEQASAVLPILLEDIYVPEAKKFVGENWDNLPEPVKEVVIDMDFNMGYERTKPDGTKGGLVTFKNFREALQKGDLKKAAQEIENSSYFKNKGSHERAVANIDKILRSL
jgi:GH24 family phage-related lysozyme (muramidase)